MQHINKYLRNFKPYKLASHKVWNVSLEERKNILKLDWNESSQNPSPLVKERISEIVNDGSFFNLYPSTQNIHLLFALANYSGLPTENVQYFGSSDSLHEYISKLYISVGDPVLIIWPSYDNFRLTAEVNGGYVHYFEYNYDFTFDLDAFIKKMDFVLPSLVYICNPNNPCGYLHNVDSIKLLLNKYPETMFLIDEAYYEFAGKESTCSQLVLKYDNLLISRTMSKAFGIANFRIGYLLSSSKNIQYISSIRNPKNITTFAQVAAIAVLEDEQYMWNYVKEVNYAKKYFINEIKKFNIVPFPSYGNFVLFRMQNSEIKQKLYQYLENHDIFIRNVSQSSSVNLCLRITIGTIGQMERVIKCIDNFFKDNHE